MLGGLYGPPLFTCHTRHTSVLIKLNDALEQISLFTVTPVTASEGGGGVVPSGDSLDNE